MADGVGESWRRIVTWYEGNTTPGTLVMPPGASEEMVLVGEAEMGLRLPEDLRAFYRLNDGLGGSFLLHYGEFLSLDRVVSHYASTPRPGDPGTEVEPFRLAGPIRPTWWSLLRVQITDNSGDGVMVDLDPLPGGTVGQVIKFDHEDGPVRVLAPSFAAWPVRIAAALEAGKLSWQPEDEWVAPPGYSTPGAYLKDWEAGWV